jgi:CheY-like chemotaxis protein
MPQARWRGPERDHKPARTHLTPWSLGYGDRYVLRLARPAPDTRLYGGATLPHHQGSHHFVVFRRDSTRFSGGEVGSPGPDFGGVARHLHSVPVPSPRDVAGPVRVVLADDHRPLRRTLRRLLEREQDLDVIAEAADFESALRQVRRYRPAVLVLDLRMSDGSIAERIHRLHEGSPMTRVVVITMEQSQRFAEQAHRAGAIGFVLKDSADTELCDAIRHAARNVRYESPRVRQP